MILSNIFGIHRSPNNFQPFSRESRGTFIFLCGDIHPGVRWSGKSKWYDLSLHKSFCSADPFPSTNFSELWEILFRGKTERETESTEGVVVNEKEHRKDAVTIISDLRINLSRTGKKNV